MAGDWSSLPSDILACISGILSTDADLLHIHQVCVHWRASTPPAAFRPWLIAGESPPNKTIPIGTYSIQAPCGDRRRVLNVRAPAGLPYCLGAPRGWLSLTDNERSPTRLVLWDPVSKAEIPLPPLHSVTQVFLSDDPVAAASSWTAIAFQMDDQEDGHKVLRLLVWRPAGDDDAANWTLLHHRFARRIETVAFKGTWMYCTDGIRSILRCDLRTGYTRTFTVDGAVERLRAGSSDGDWCGSMVGSHVVSCNGEVDMIVLMHVACRRPRAEVCRLRRSTRPRRVSLPGHFVVEVGERVTDLGDYSLFLGRGDGFALSAKEFPAIKRNRIYYVAGEEIRLFGENHWALVFDLELDAVEVIYADEFREYRGGSW